MSLSNAAENAILQLIFQNTAWANIGDATGPRGSTTPGSFWFSLHNADPGEAGTAITNETAYAGYARVAAARSSGGFTVSGSSVSPAATVTFPTCTGAGDTITHFGVVSTASGAGILVTKGVIGTGGVKPFTADATADLITSAAHGFAAGDRVVFEAIEGLSLPTGITEGTVYFVIATGLTTDAFAISTTSGGAAVNITVSGGGMLFKCTPLVVTSSPAVTPALTTTTAFTLG